MGKMQHINSRQQKQTVVLHRVDRIPFYPDFNYVYCGEKPTACMHPWEPKEFSVSQEMQQLFGPGIKNLEKNGQNHLRKDLGP